MIISQRAKIPDDAPLHAMRTAGGEWAAYQNHELGHPEYGHLRFLKVGPGCTYAEPPQELPDSHLGIGWRYRLVGIVDVEKGEIIGGDQEVRPA